MKQKLKTTNLFGIINPDNEKKRRFDESKIFSEEMHYSILLDKIKIYFGTNKKGNNNFLGFESSYINYTNGQKLKGEYHGMDKTEENIEIKEMVMKEYEYINNFEFAFDNDFNYITYLKIISSKGNELEFGERPEKLTALINYKGDNMIQFLWGYYDNDEGIKAIGFKYTSRKQFIFHRILPILGLRYKIIHDKEFKNKIEKKNKLLIKDISMIYLYRACKLPEAIFAKIIKYC